jgi:hypothetical protein
MKKVEIWKDIKDYEGLYQISSWGRVKSLGRIKMSGFSKNGTFYREKILCFVTLKKGYYSVGLCKNSIVKRFLVHRLVAIAFIPNPENKPEVNHLDCIKTNNFVWNLEWVTSLENNNHAWKNGLFGIHMKRIKLIKLEVIEIRKKYDTGNYSQRQLAKEYNVSESLIGGIIRYKVWKHIKRSA